MRYRTVMLLYRFFKFYFCLAYVWSILGFTRSITKNESQLISSALRANYSKMFSGMIRKFSSYLYFFVLLLSYRNLSILTQKIRVVHPGSGC
jgi:hypothetical protein